MDRLEIEDLKQLVNFYRQKVGELEFAVLQNQLFIPRIIREKENLESVNISLQNKVNALIAENDSLKEKQDSIKKKAKNKKQG